MMNLFGRLAKNEFRVTAIEYGVIAALIGVGMIVAATQLGIGMSPPSGRSPWGIGAAASNH